MSKLSFRARALDAAKPLPIYRNGDIPDLNDCVSINRAVPQMPTGMEKEEELEHHLQRAICAQQVFREKKESMVIPVPEAEGNINYYDRLYKGDFRQPKQLIHIQPFGLDSEQPDYDMDSEDETLLNRLNRKMELKPLQFEIMVDRLEKASANQLVTLQEAKLLLNEDDYLLKSVYDYWVRKRKNCRGPSLIPQVKQEKRDGSTNNDAYVAFRRRTEKMQTRKNRKNDEASYEKMLKLRREFSRTVTILEMIKKREKSKRELLHLTLEVVEKRYQLGDFSGDVLSEVSVPLAEKTVYPAPICLPNGNRHKTENKIKSHKSVPKHHPHNVTVKVEPHFDFVRPHKKYTRRPKLETLRPPSRPERPHTVNNADIKQYDFHSSGEEDYLLSPSSEPDEENDPDGAFVFRRRVGCSYLAPLSEQSSSSPVGLAGTNAMWQRNALTALSVPRRCVGVARRRLGRGGRLLLDRSSADLDRALRHLDPGAFCPFVAPSDAFPLNTDTHMDTCTNAHDPAPFRTHPQRSLAQLLTDIQACRWRYFQTRSLHQNQKEESGKKALQEDDRRGGGPIVTSSGITEEQFQTHQQQLAQMQQQQLAQFQQQGLQQNSALPEHPHSHASVCITPYCTLYIAYCHCVSFAVHKGASVVVMCWLMLLRDKKSIFFTGFFFGFPSGSRQTKFSSSGSSSARLSGASSKPLPAVPQSLPHGHGPLSSVSAVSPAHTHHNSARPCAPSPPALKLATIASSLDRVPKVTPASAIDSIGRDKHEPERLALNGIAETTVAMEVT
uniref:Enhancer of polycomb homolog n=1 Tax=Pygocentrus nattereri TaxID=42514 RepID=A0AAR2JWC7_PYGNA